jgi:ferredoxin-like protein FixX
MADLPKVNVDEKLGTLTYKADHQAHITLKSADVCRDRCHDRPCTTVCPAQVYRWEDPKRNSSSPLKIASNAAPAACSAPSTTSSAIGPGAVSGSSTATGNAPPGR